MLKSKIYYSVFLRSVYLLISQLFHKEKLTYLTSSGASFNGLFFVFPQNGGLKISLGLKCPFLWKLQTCVKEQYPFS